MYRTWAVAERGAVPHLLDVLSEAEHPWSIKEAAAQALELLAHEAAGGPAQESVPALAQCTHHCTLHSALTAIRALCVPQESITEHGGVKRLLACYRSEGCTRACKEGCARALRYLAVYKEAKVETAALGILQPFAFSCFSDIIL